MYLAFQGGSDWSLPHLGIYPNDTAKLVTNFRGKSMGNLGQHSHILHEQKHILKLYKFVFLSWILIAWKLLQRNQGARSNIQQKYTIKVGF